MNEKENLFIQLYCIDKINSFEKIANKEGYNNCEIARNKYKSINKYLAEVISSELRTDITVDEVRDLFVRLDARIAEYQDLFNKYNTEERIAGFKSFNCFLEWYSNQKPRCHYCGTTEENLKKLFKNEIFKPKKEAWKNGSLQIERLDPNAGYSPKNCVLACVLCNNAKSDLISDQDFHDYFETSFKAYLDDKIKLLK